MVVETNEKRIYRGNKVSLIPKNVEVLHICRFGYRNHFSIIQYNGKRYNTLTRLCHKPKENQNSPHGGNTTQSNILDYMS